MAKKIKNSKKTTPAPRRKVGGINKKGKKDNPIDPFSVAPKDLIDLPSIDM